MFCATWRTLRPNSRTVAISDSGHARDSFMRLVCLSDTHGLHNSIHVPEGDVLIHAGDFCNTGTEREVHKFAKWLNRLPHRWKIVVAGNHDWFFQKQPELARAYLEPDVIYLQDSGCEIEGLKIWGSPWQPWFMDWAFNLPRRGAALREKWSQIPLATDILITHSPPHGTLDEVRSQSSAFEIETASSGPLGCEHLADRLPAVLPGLHVFGHIHDGHGHLVRDRTLHVNASICDERYEPIHHPIVVDVDLRAAQRVFEIASGGEEVSELPSHGRGQTFHVVDGNIPLTAFHGAHIRAMKLRQLGQFFLGEAAREASLSEVRGEEQASSGAWRRRWHMPSFAF